MVRALVFVAMVVSVAGCSPGLWVDDGYYMCISGSCPSVAPYCWRDLHCHTAPEDAGIGTPDTGAADVDAGPTDAGETLDANGLPPTYERCSTSTPCAMPGEFCSPIGVCTRECAHDSECAAGSQCSPNELRTRPAYCRPGCGTGCPGTSACAFTRSADGELATTGYCIDPYSTDGTLVLYTDCHSDATCGPYTCVGRVSPSQPGICILPCSTTGPLCPVGMACVQTAGTGMPYACLFACTAASASEDCIPQHGAPRCEMRSGQLVCIDADGL